MLKRHLLIHLSKHLQINLNLILLTYSQPTFLLYRTLKGYKNKEDQTV